MKAEVLRFIEAFQGLDEKHLSMLTGICREISFSKGSTILDESGEGRDLYAVLEGRIEVRMEKVSIKHGSERLTRLNEGEIFGEMAFVSSMKRSALVRAVSDTKILVFDGPELWKLIEREPYLGYIMMRNIARIICQRLRDTDLMWRNLIMG